MEQLIEVIMNYVELDEIKPEMNFRTDLGLGSFDTVCMIDEIKDTIGVSLKPADFVTHKTVGEMAQYMKSLK